jgi:hypothetical protein
MPNGDVVMNYRSSTVTIADGLMNQRNSNHFNQAQGHGHGSANNQSSPSSIYGEGLNGSIFQQLEALESHNATPNMTHVTTTNSFPNGSTPQPLPNLVGNPATTNFDEAQFRRMNTAMVQNQFNDFNVRNTDMFSGVPSGDSSLMLTHALARQRDLQQLEQHQMMLAQQQRNQMESFQHFELTSTAINIPGNNNSRTSGPAPGVSNGLGSGMFGAGFGLGDTSSIAAFNKSRTNSVVSLGSNRSSLGNSFSFSLADSAAATSSAFGTPPSGHGSASPSASTTSSKTLTSLSSLNSNPSYSGSVLGPSATSATVATGRQQGSFYFR